MADYFGSVQGTLPAATDISTMVLVVQSDDNNLDRLVPEAIDGRVVFSKLERFFGKAARGAVDANVMVQAPTAAVGSGIGLSYAVGTIAISRPANSVTYTIGDVTFTGNTSTPTPPLEFSVTTSGATQTQTAVNLANAINAYAPSATLVAATNRGSTVDITSRIPGNIGNFISQSTGDNWATVSAATLAGGSNISMAYVGMGL